MNPFEGEVVSVVPESLAAPAGTLVAEPFLHYSAERIYNTLTDSFLSAGEPGFQELQLIRNGQISPADLPENLMQSLLSGGWLMESGADPGSRFRLKYVSFEASTVCNQGCYFCPVSVDRREDHSMTMEMYERITAQLAEHRATIDGVSMIHYNEPTADKRFLDQVRVLKRYGLPPAVLTNATGLTPDRVDAILDMGGLRYLSVNLSTLDRERYKADRGGDHLRLVLRNLDYLKDKPLAPKMDLAVLGRGDATHRKDYEEIRAYFAKSRFDVQYYEVMDRAGAIPLGLRPERPHARLCGCEQTGSRVVQWVHITPHADCVLCCQDYKDNYIVGNLHQQSLDEILSGPRMSLMRRWVYGIEEAPADFICRGCIYALTS
ncbi:MAG TPA: radical SAM protein [Thermoanaerobaculia bacterium]|nr:radical SAM protein [Thermoanaerobaculia bacterium]